MARILLAAIAALFAILGWQYLTGSRQDAINPISSAAEKIEVKADYRPDGVLSASAISPSAASPGRSSRIDEAEAAIGSADPLTVREQLEEVRNCLGVAKREDELLVVRSGIIPQHLATATEEEKTEIIAATTIILDSCGDFRKLGKVKLNDLFQRLRKYGETINSPLLQQPDGTDQHRRAMSSLVTSSVPILIELGAYEMIKQLTVDSSGDLAKVKDGELWDRAILIAGCTLANSCARNSVQSATMCLQSKICNIGVDQYWLSDLDTISRDETALRAKMVTQWLRSSSAQEVFQVKDYSALARAVGRS